MNAMRWTTSLVFVTTLVLLTRMADAADEAIVPPDKLVYCTVCHGVQLRGNPVIQAPRLNGLSGWYVEHQLLAFKRGWRGTHEKDLYGMEMQPMAAALSEAGIGEAVRYVTAVSSEAPPATVEADAEKGRTLYASCIPCHGNDGHGNETVRGPALAGQSDWYLVRQLMNFREGVRGAHPDDTDGARMRAAASLLKDDEDVKNVVAYINSLQDR